MKLAERGPDICGIAGVPGTGRAGQIRHRQSRGFGDTIEIEPCIQEIVPSQPSGAERDFVNLAIRHRVATSVSRFDMVMHVLLGTGGDDVEHMIGHVVGINLDAAPVVIAQDAPAGQAIFEIAIGNELHGAVRRRLDDADVVHEAFALAKQAENEVVPLFGPDEGLGHRGKVTCQIQT